MPQINFVVAVFGAAIGVIWMGEALNWTLIAALVIVLTAISLISRPLK